MNFHIFFAQNSEISSKLTPKKNLELSKYSELLPEKNLELSKYSELRSETTTLIRKISSDSEIIPSQLGEKFRISFANFGAISELHSEKNSELHLGKFFKLYLEKISKLHLGKSFRTTFGQKLCTSTENFYINFHKIKKKQIYV